MSELGRRGLVLAPSALISAQRPRECVQNYAKMLPSGGSSRQCTTRKQGRRGMDVYYIQTQYSRFKETTTIFLTDFSVEIWGGGDGNRRGFGREIGYTLKCHP